MVVKLHVGTAGARCGTLLCWKEQEGRGRKGGKRAVPLCSVCYGTYGTYTKTRSVHKMVRARMQLRALLITIWPAGLLQRLAAAS